MRGPIGTLAAYFGLSDDDATDALRLEYVRPALMGSASWAAALAAVSAAFVLAVFGWELAGAAVGATAGAAFWGTLYFFAEVRDRVPHGALLEPPPGAVVENAESSPRLRVRRRIALLVPLGFGLAWLADRWDLGALFVPGQFLGMAAAALAGAAFVGRWERTHEKRALAVRDLANAEDLYAIPAHRLVGEG